VPLSPDERFGNVNLSEICERLGEARFLHRSGGNWYWVQEAYPADTISLRSVTSDNFVIIDTTGVPTFDIPNCVAPARQIQVALPLNC
jgi:DEAD/DEAH box helicase domain-containing protein